MVELSSNFWRGRLNGCSPPLDFEVARRVIPKSLFRSNTYDLRKLGISLPPSTDFIASAVFRNCWLNRDLILRLTCCDFRIARSRFSYSPIKSFWRWLVTAFVLKTSKLVTLPPAALRNSFLGSRYLGWQRTSLASESWVFLPQSYSAQKL